MEKTYGPLQAAVADSIRQQDELIAKITVSFPTVFLSSHMFVPALDMMTDRYDDKT